MHSVIVHSVRGTVHELVGFTVYQMDLALMLKVIEKCFGKKLTGDKL